MVKPGTASSSATQDKRKDTSLLVTSGNSDRLSSSSQHSKHHPQDSLHPTACPCHLQAGQRQSQFFVCSYCREKQSLHQRPNAQIHTPGPPPHKDCACVVDSFSALSVSNSSNSPLTSHVGPSQQSLSLLRSCREQAAAAGSGLDDTTVDDLAGYLDEIMFIPKPMSEMAELMYT